MATQESNLHDELKIEELLAKASGICACMMGTDDADTRTTNAAWAAHDLIEEALGIYRNGSVLLGDAKRESAVHGG